MSIEELSFDDFIYLQNHGDYKNFVVIEDDRYGGIEILKDTLKNTYYRIIGYSPSKYEEVFPTEITKIVYLPKDLC